VNPAVWAHRSGPQSSREARGRALRREFLLETARQIGARRVALGHTLDDQAESFLLRLLRGSGARGLGGTYPVVDGIIVRPLLEIRRRDLLAWLRERRLRYRVDETNRDPAHLRNRVRLRLLPLLEAQFNPAATEALAHAADLLREEDRHLNGLAEAAFRALAEPRRQGVFLPARGLAGQPLAIRRRVLRLAMAEARGDLRRLELRHVEQAQRLLDEPHGRRSFTLPGGTMVRRAIDGLVFGPRGAGEAAGPGRGAEGAEAAGPPREALCPVPGEVAIDGFDLRLKASVVPRDAVGADLRSDDRGRAFLDADLLPGPLLIRPRRPGDRFVPLGAPGTRKVKAFLIDRKVPVEDRGRIPLVLSGDRIAWIVGHEIDDRFKVTAGTHRVLVLEREPR
jgi:tRNA(Ile)-lysidine synthase